MKISFLLGQIKVDKENFGNLLSFKIFFSKKKFHSVLEELFLLDMELKLFVQILWMLVLPWLLKEHYLQFVKLYLENLQLENILTKKKGRIEHKFFKKKHLLQIRKVYFIIFFKKKKKQIYFV